MTKLKSTIYLLAFFWITSIVLYSCCELKYRIIDGDGFLYVNRTGCIRGFNLCAVAEEFELIYEANAEEIGSLGFSPIQSALATSCYETFIDKVDLETVSLTFDKPFLFNGEIIQAGSNIAEIPEVIVEGFQQEVTFQFSTEMLAQTEMLSDTITISFSAIATNDIELSAENDVVFNF